MTRNIEYRKVIRNILQTCGIPVYFRNAPKMASFPYMIFSYKKLSNDWSDNDQLALDITIYTKESDTSGIESIADLVCDTLNFASNSDPNVVLTFFSDNRSYDEDETIKSIFMMYSVSAYYRKG